MEQSFEFYSSAGTNIIYNRSNCQALSEILAYWYPSHQAFLSMKDAPYREENFLPLEKWFIE